MLIIREIKAIMYNDLKAVQGANSLSRFQAMALLYLLSAVPFVSIVFLEWADICNPYMETNTSLIIQSSDSVPVAVFLVNKLISREIAPPQTCATKMIVAHRLYCEFRFFWIVMLCHNSRKTDSNVAKHLYQCTTTHAH